MNNRIVDYMRLFTYGLWVPINGTQRYPEEAPELDEVQREIHHKDPRAFIGTQRPEVKSL